MKRIEYSMIVRQKLKILRNNLVKEYGIKVARSVIKQITEAVKSLGKFWEKGVSVSAMFEVDCDYRYLYVCRNYLFYRIEVDRIIIVEMFDEREDFMRKLFGIDTTPMETYDYWEE